MEEMIDIFETKILNIKTFFWLTVDFLYAKILVVLLCAYKGAIA